MCDKDIQITSSKAASKQDSGSDGGTTPAVKTNLTDLKSVTTEMLSSFKTELLTQVNESISQVYRDFEQVAEPEVQDDNLSVTEVDVLPAQSGASLLEKITNFANETGSQSKTQTDITASENKVFKSFVEQFATGKRTGPAIDHDLATLVNDLLTEKLPKEKLEPVQDKYLKPENCENLIAPKSTRDPRIVQSFKSKCKIASFGGSLNNSEFVNHWRIIVFRLNYYS